MGFNMVHCVILPLVMPLRPPSAPGASSVGTRSEFVLMWPSSQIGSGQHREARAPGGSASSPRLTLMVPAYFYPVGPGEKFWEMLIQAAPRAPIVVIANPASGPGAQEDPNYTQMLDRVSRAEITVIGYVATSYAKRNLSEVKSDIDRWLRFYPQIKGILLDEQTSGADRVDYYADLGKYIRARIPKALVVSNPGTVCAEEYISHNVVDVVCLFENHTGFHAYEAPSWAARYPARRVCFLPYQTAGVEMMKECVRQAVRKRAGYFFTTDDGADGNPWDSLPSYWNELVEAVRRVNSHPGQTPPEKHNR